MSLCACVSAFDCECNPLMPWLDAVCVPPSSSNSKSGWICAQVNRVTTPKYQSQSNLFALYKDADWSNHIRRCVINIGTFIHFFFFFYVVSLLEENKKQKTKNETEFDCLICLFLCVCFLVDESLSSRWHLENAVRFLLLIWLLLLGLNILSPLRIDKRLERTRRSAFRRIDIAAAARESVIPSFF